MGQKLTVPMDEVNIHLTEAGAAETLSWAANQFGDSVSIACSFGAEDVVLLDLAQQAGLKIRAFVLDTGRLHQETYEVMDSCRKRYDMEFEIYFPQTHAVQNLMRSKGPNSFYLSVENRKECCGIRKVEPLSRALLGLDAWVTGLRREQSVTRLDLPVVEADDSHHGIIKINPLALWSQAQVWDHIRAHRVPYNALHDQGFPSIGCAPCTRAISPGEDVRAGRWWWENPELKECGLHVRK